MGKEDYSDEFNEGRYANQLMGLFQSVSRCVSDGSDFGTNAYEIERLEKAKTLIYEAEHSYFIRHRLESKEERLQRIAKEGTGTA
jgi:hypothetical protein